MNNRLLNIFLGLGFFLFLLAFFSFDTKNVKAIDASEEEYIFVFVREGCSACAKEESFLKTFTDKNIKISLLDIGDKNNYDNFIKIVEKNDLAKVTPVTLVGGEVLVGFDGADGTGKRIKELADNEYSNVNIYLDENYKSRNESSAEVCKITGEDACSTDEIKDNSFKKIKIPFFGVIDTKNFSLMSLAIIIGFIDGFNPCAMWVLVAFLIALSQVGSQLKMFIVAGLFVIAESIMYFFILNVWYNAWDFVKLDWLVVPIVGVISIGAGGYFLYKFRKNNGQLICDVTSLEHQRKTTTKIKDIATSPLTILGAFVIIGLAFSVNIIEFACSVGLPQSFTKILELNDPGFWGRQFYIMIYTLFYMVDDFIIFGLAIFGYRKFYQFGAKYSNLALLIGGILLIIIGIMMIFGKNVFVF